MRKPSAFILALAIFLGVVGSASGQATTRVKKNPNEIAVAELQEPAIKARSALDAIQRLRPNWIRSRGSTNFQPSVALSKQPGCGGGPNNPSTSCNSIQKETTGKEVPGVLLNEVPQDFDILRSLKALEVSRLIFMSAADATTQYGTGYPNGLILIWTTQP